MSDLTKSNILRGALFAVSLMVLLFAVVVVDGALEHIFKGWRFMPSSPIETYVFIYVVSNVIWKWLSRRVWIGVQHQ